LSEFICNTSPLQYLHQLGLLDILRKLTGNVIMPPAVVGELQAGRSKGASVPDPAALAWVTIRIPTSALVMPLITDLGAGEREVLALARESADAIAILDDGAARRVAAVLGIRHRGTLGVLLDAKRAGLVAAVQPILDRLQVLGFRLDARTRQDVLELAGEAP
jgi:predicted nucleic acid-binding protein